MKLLIVNLHLDIGGVETLLVRLIPLLQKSGAKITLILLQNKCNTEFLDAIKPFCDVRFFLGAFPFTKSSIKKFLDEEFDVAFYTISQGFVLGSWLLTRAGYLNTKVVLGAYQTEIFCADAGVLRYHRRMIHDFIVDHIPQGSIVFGNEAGRDFHANKLGKRLDLSPVIRLFVDVDKYRFVDRRSLVRKKIVSIGRITGYKTYNFTMLPVVKKLIDEGIDLQWHVYGDGDQYDEFKRSIRHAGLTDVVFAHGALNYSKFEEVLEDAFLFVGSGTSLIEAAACGVPSLTTIEYSKDPVTYGFISEISGFNLIEPGLDKPVLSLHGCISKILNLSDSEYYMLQTLDYMKSQAYGGASVVQEYLDVFQRSSEVGVNIKIGNLKFFLYLVSAFFGHCSNKASGLAKKIFSRYWFFSS